ncbi:MAG TPA: hypothetical protein VHD61_15695 [Lacunisphaera sp.]|nr:hypothetical protein [Lacunisphaera sp.]
MKFFAALIARLTGGADAPKTLDQAKATFADAKAALDSVVKLFTAAALDFDDLMAKGENSLRDLIAGIRGEVTTAQAATTKAQGDLTAERDAHTTTKASLTAAKDYNKGLLALFASIDFKPAELKDKDGNLLTGDALAAELQKQFKAATSKATVAQIRELGFNAGDLPAKTENPGGESATLAELQTQMAAEKDPTKLGQLAARANALRNKAWGVEPGKN